VHSDSNYSEASSRLVTMFVALHDVLDERMGPTHFWPNTHKPRCFPGGVWFPPTASLAAERRSVWYALRAGDAVLMDACTWHRGGANTSGTRRTLLAASFVASEDRDERVPRLGDFAINETELIIYLRVKQQPPDDREHDRLQAVRQDPRRQAAREERLDAVLLRDAHHNIHVGVLVRAVAPPPRRL
jgi:ectoine hydroxylase-related dioxygenase (phytanoyl-CoA dioxygenase family)